MEISKIWWKTIDPRSLILSIINTKKITPRYIIVKLLKDDDDKAEKNNTLLSRKPDMVLMSYQPKLWRPEDIEMAKCRKGKITKTCKKNCIFS